MPVSSLVTVHAPSGLLPQTQKDSSVEVFYIGTLLTLSIHYAMINLGFCCGLLPCKVLVSFPNP